MVLADTRMPIALARYAADRTRVIKVLLSQDSVMKKKLFKNGAFRVSLLLRIIIQTYINVYITIIP